VERLFAVAVAHGGQTAGLAGALLGSGKVERVFRLEAVRKRSKWNPTE
jgi:hypothetical protein